MNADVHIDMQLLWEQLTQEKFVKQDFATALLLDCGNDGDEVDVSDLLNLLNGDGCGNYKDVLWAFGEVMHYYAVDAVNDPQQYVRAVFVSVTLAQGTAAGMTEWTLHFEPICNFFCTTSTACDTYTRGELLRKVVCQAAEKKTF